MLYPRLTCAFFNRPTLTVARDLLGKILVRQYRGRCIVGMVNETEAYIGPADRAAHSFLPAEKVPQGWHSKFHAILRPHVADPRTAFEQWAKTKAKITPRTIAEYLDGGTIYIYMVYGMHWQLNFSTGSAGKPECVLIRSVVPVVEGVNGKWGVSYGNYRVANGPGKLCNYFKLDKSFYAKKVCDCTCGSVSLTVGEPWQFWIEDRGISFSPRQVFRGPRVGIDYAGKYWAQKPWRFWVD